MLSCSLRATSRPRHPRRARRSRLLAPPRGSGWLRALGCPSLRATAPRTRGRWADGCLRRGLRTPDARRGQRPLREHVRVAAARTDRACVRRSIAVKEAMYVLAAEYTRAERASNARLMSSSPYCSGKTRLSPRSPRACDASKRPHRSLPAAWSKERLEGDVRRSDHGGKAECEIRRCAQRTKARALLGRRTPRSSAFCSMSFSARFSGLERMLTGHPTW